MKSTKRSIALILATLMAVTLQIASAGALFTPVPIPMPAQTQPAGPRAQLFEIAHSPMSV